DELEGGDILRLARDLAHAQRARCLRLIGGGLDRHVCRHPRPSWLAQYRRLQPSGQTIFFYRSNSKIPISGRAVLARPSALMNLRQLEPFYWVAKLGSFSAAADRLNATQSTVSMRIQDLERDFGHTLFDRGRRGARITAMGRELMRYAEEVL